MLGGIRLGLIARADDRGLGIQTWEMYRHLVPTKTLVVDCPSQNPLPLRLERYPDARVVTELNNANIREFLKGLDLVITCETPYNYDLFLQARARGVRTILQYNWEFLDYLKEPNLPAPDLFMSPSSWHYPEFPYFNKVHLPVPVATDRFEAGEPSVAFNFLHTVGRPAIHDRNGTSDLLSALHHVTQEVNVSIFCQKHDYIAELEAQIGKDRYPDNVYVSVTSGGLENYWDVYAGQHVLVLPRRYGGLSLPANEALAASMPVIMPDIEPNNDWLPDEWLVPASLLFRFEARTKIDVYGTDIYALAAKIDEMVMNPEYYRASSRAAALLADTISWDTLQPEYENTFWRVLQGEFDDVAVG